jgi:hypothetical protein
MSDIAYWNLAMDPDKYGGLRKFEWSEPVWAGVVHV